MVPDITKYKYDNNDIINFINENYENTELKTTNVDTTKVKWPKNAKKINGKWVEIGEEKPLYSTNKTKTEFNKKSPNFKEQVLRLTYYNPKSRVAYSSIKNIWDYIKTMVKLELISKNLIKYKDVKEFLLEQPTYTTHKQIIRKFETRKTMVSYVDQQWQADLIDMKNVKNDNNDYWWILNIIDIFSRYVWSIPLKRKTGIETVEAFNKIISPNLKPEKIQFDDGTEFYNKEVTRFLKLHKIKYFSTKSEKKAAVVERFNRTLKTRMWKYFTANNTYKWLDILPKLVIGYNNSKHSSIGMTPINARKDENTEIVWNNLYGVYVTHDFGEPKYKVDQQVRISKYKKTFDKGYERNFTREIYKIKQIIITKPYVYKLEDLGGEEIDGYFYEEELSLTTESLEKEFKIEKILKTKTVKGKKYILVKWEGWPDKFNDWILSSKINNI